MLLARAGLSVLLVDRDAPGSDTLSTHALMRTGVLQLHRWGLLHGVTSAGVARIERTTFHYGVRAIEVEIRQKYGVDALYAPRRTILDALLQRAAVAAGVELMHGVSLVGLLRERNDAVAGARLRNRNGDLVELSARWVIGADGRRSKVAELVRAAVQHAGRHATATVYGHFSGVSNQGYQWYYGNRVAAGVIPTAAGQACVFASVPHDDFRRWLRNGKTRALFDTLGVVDPELARSLAPGSGSLRGFSGASTFVKTAAGPGWALVGDAGYYKDPVTAHGISDALRDAELLARALIRGTPAAMAEYQVQRDALALEFLRLTDEIASLDGDFERLGRLHRALSREVNRESEMVASWSPLLAVTPPTHRVA